MSNKTEIFNSYADFRDREDRSINGVSPQFAERNPQWQQMNATNVGCWDCEDCEFCTECKDCEDCTDCKFCTGCEDCVDCEACKFCTDCTDCKFCTDCTGCDGDFNSRSCGKKR